MNQTSPLRNGFTLIEIMVVVVIIALLATITAINFKTVRVKGRDTRRISNITTLHTALEAYYNDHGVYPPTSSVVPGQPLMNSAGTKTYLDEVPFNPQPRTDHGCPDSEYMYTVAPNSKSYSLSTCISETGNPDKSKLIYSDKEGLFHCGDTITDRDNYTYKTVSIGSQCWMAENLKTKTLPDRTCLNTQKHCTGFPRICTTNADCASISPAGQTCINYNSTMSASTCTWLYSGTQYASSSRADGRDCISTTNTQGTNADCDAGRALYQIFDALQCSNRSGDVGLGGCSPTTLTDVMCCGSGWVNNQKVQGICPNGWHIPTEQEFSTLEKFLSDDPNACDPARFDPSTGPYQCVGAGTRLRVGGSSGFNAQLIGIRRGRTDTIPSCIPTPDLPLPPPICPAFPGNTTFTGAGGVDWFMTSNIPGPNSTLGDSSSMRVIDSTFTGVARQSKKISAGRAMSLRCIKD